MRTEVLRDIKKTEEEYRTTIQAAQEERKHRRSQAELEADNLVTKATSNAEEYKKLKLEEARRQAASRHAEIVRDGESKAAALKQKGAKQLNKAVQFLVVRFREQLHAGA